MVRSITKIITLVILIIFSGVVSLSAQQFPNYSLYYMNKYTINPAIAGANGATNLSLIAREESVGFEGTPKTHAFSFDSRILGESNIYKNFFQRYKREGKTTTGNVGWGLYLYSDLNGPIDKTGINGTYSYHIDFNDSQLSFGISLVLFQLSIQKDGFITDDGETLNDPLLAGGNESIWITDANFGVYYSAADFYCGYSTIQLFNSFAQFGANGQGVFKLTRQHTIIGGYKYKVNNMFKLEPMTLIKIDENLIAQANLGFRVIYNKRFWGGINYRTMNTLSFHCGINIDKYNITYAFDYGINSMSRHTLGTHELIASVSFDSAKTHRKIFTF